MTVRQRIKRRPSIAKREFKAAPPEFADGSLICRDMRKVTPNAKVKGCGDENK